MLVLANSNITGFYVDTKQVYKKLNSKVSDNTQQLNIQMKSSIRNTSYKKRLQRGCA